LHGVPLNIFTDGQLDHVEKYQAGKRFWREDEAVIFAK
jgi:hypothetical protein